MNHASHPLGLRALLSGLICDTSLVAPSPPDVHTAVARLVDAHHGPHGWMMSRYVLPSCLLEEWEQTTAMVTIRRPIEVALNGDAEGSLRAIERFIARQVTDEDEAPSIDAIRVRIDSAEDVDRLAMLVPASLRVWFEITPTPQLHDILRAIVRFGNGAALRLTRDRHDTRDVAHVIVSCLRTGVLFKTVGQAESVINLSMAATLARALVMEYDYRRSDTDVAEAIVPMLDEAEPAAFHWDDDGVTWHGHRVSVHAIQTARRWFVQSCDSCTYAELL